MIFSSRWIIPSALSSRISVFLQTLKRSRVLAASLGLIFAGCEPESPVTPMENDAVTPLVETVFDDVAEKTGIDFLHFLGATGDYYFPEIAGSGVALFDYDNDGDLDIYAIQGAMLEAGKAAAESIIPPANKVPSNQLYRNDLIPNGTLHFTNVTTESGLGDTGYGMGVAVGDTDNDGDPDVFASNFGRNRFYVNNGDGTFSEAPDAISVKEERWTTSASFFDFDKDGDLDLFATNYVGFTLENNIECSGTKGQREYCGPTIYPPTTDQLWRNEGNNHFVEISEESGISAAAGNGLGTSATDFDADGDIDIYVANDLQANRLWLQDPDGRFTDTALMSGAAYNGRGVPEASMGVTAGDFDGDGDEDLFMTHLAAQTNTLYLNEDGNFTDYTDMANLGSSSLNLTGFGTAWLDYDNDGLLDLFIANGAVLKLSNENVDPMFPFGQINQLLHNEDGRFQTVDGSAVMDLAETSRGAGFGDIDNDGDIDVVVSNGNGPMRLLLNKIGQSQNWLRVKLVGVTSNRDGAGARVILERIDGTRVWRRAHTDGSYLSASDIRVHFGLGGDTAIKAVAVIWPSGKSEQWSSIEPNQELILVEGQGSPWTP